MPLTAEEAYGLIVLHGIDLERYGKTVVREVVSILETTQTDIEARLNGSYPDQDNLRSADSLRLRGVLEQINTLQVSANAALTDVIVTGIVTAASDEAAFVNRLGAGSVQASANMAGVSEAQLIAAATRNPFEGKLLKDYASELGANWRNRTRAQIVTGYMQGEPSQAIQRRLRNTVEISKRGADLVVRTGVTHLNVQATRIHAEQNLSLFPRYQWVSTLDSRTSPVCRARAGKIYETGKGPVPPAHYRCRSRILNLAEGMDEAPELDYGSWLEGQSAETQNDILGPTRRKLWKRGEVKLDRFVDRSGNQLTLDDLKKRNAKAFERAGI